MRCASSKKRMKTTPTEIIKTAIETYKKRDLYKEFFILIKSITEMTKFSKEELMSFVEAETKSFTDLIERQKQKPTYVHSRTEVHRTLN